METAGKFNCTPRIILDNIEEHQKKSLSDVSQTNDHTFLPIYSTDISRRVLQSQKIFVSSQPRIKQQSDLRYKSLPPQINSSQFGSPLSLLPKAQNSPMIQKNDGNLSFSSQIDFKHRFSVPNIEKDDFAAVVDTANTSTGNSNSNLTENQRDKFSNSLIGRRIVRIFDVSSQSPLSGSENELPIIKINLDRIGTGQLSARNYDVKELKGMKASDNKETQGTHTHLLDSLEAKSILFLRNPETSRWDHSNYVSTVSKERVSSADVQKFFKRVENSTQELYEETFSITSFLKAFIIGVPAMVCLILGLILVMLERADFGIYWTPQLTAGVTLTIAGAVLLIFAIFCGFNAYEVKKARKKYSKTLREVITQQNAEVQSKKVEWVLNPIQDAIELKLR